MVIRKIEFSRIFRDRKKKKFVQADDGSKIKKIRTEEGTLLPATYKSGRYQKWQDQKKIGYGDAEDANIDGDEDGDEQSKRQFDSRTIQDGRWKNNIGINCFYILKKLNDFSSK